jgi:hypothetical protein
MRNSSPPYRIRLPFGVDLVELVSSLPTQSALESETHNLVASSITSSQPPWPVGVFLAASTNRIWDGKCQEMPRSTACVSSYDTSFALPEVVADNRSARDNDSFSSTLIAAVQLCHPKQLARHV